MTEIDHTVVTPPESSTPIPASDLLAIEEKQRLLFSVRGERISTGCGEIDDYMLRGGFERGIVVGISAEAAAGRLISLHLLSSILITHLSTSSIVPLTEPKVKATIIDTTGSFPVVLLAKILKSRILELKSRIARQAVENGNYAAGEDFKDDKEPDEEVNNCLEMVAISRLFDIEGLWEVLGEVGQHSWSGNTDPESTNDEEGVEMIIIDNMTHLINELFARKERSEAHTVLTTLSRALHTLTYTRNILTVLHNTTVSSSNKSYTTDHSSETRYPDQRKQPIPNAKPTSIFPSNPLKPALGQIFSQFPDLHLLMSALPKTRQDAQQLHGQDNEDTSGSGESGREIRYCYVIEVLKDETPDLGVQSERERHHRKFGGREQRWAAVDISADELALTDAFVAKGTMRGLGLEREKMRKQDVGNVAKIYGFGGRRV